MDEPPWSIPQAGIREGQRLRREACKAAREGPDSADECAKAYSVRGLLEHYLFSRMPFNTDR
jgi:hypothetical protein